MASLSRTSSPRSRTSESGPWTAFTWIPTCNGKPDQERAVGDRYSGRSIRLRPTSRTAVSALATSFCSLGGFGALRTVGRGQEFVLDFEHYPEGFGWLQDIFANVPQRHVAAD